MEKFYRIMDLSWALAVVSSRSLQPYETERELALLCGPPLASGAQGRIYEGKKMTSKAVVFKVVDVPVSKLLDVGAVTDVLLRLRHPNLVHYESQKLIEDGAKLVLEMEKLDGTLVQLQEAHKTPVVLSMLVMDMAAALKELKAYNILHRDIAPNNILFKREHSGIYVFKLADFGLAKINEDSNTQGVGTPGFIAPEVTAGKEYGHPADMWSLGAVIRNIFPALVANDATISSLVDEMTAMRPDKRPDVTRLEQRGRLSANRASLQQLRQIHADFDDQRRLYHLLRHQLEELKKGMDSLRGKADAVLSGTDDLEGSED